MIAPPGNLQQIPSLEIAAPAKQGSLHHWKFFKVHTSLRFANGFQTSVCVSVYKKLCRQQAEVIYKMMKIQMFAILNNVDTDTENTRGCSQAYNHSSD
jgi:hypothetical protein